ncbi:MAG: MBL fold metallo-hydrolase [Acidobacteriota bacterium]
MIRFTVLGSGSTGNSVLINTETTNVLVDAGLSARETLRRLELVGIQPTQLNGILITHEHSDHAGGLRVLLNSVSCPVYISDLTKAAYLELKTGSQNLETESRRRRAAVDGRTESIESDREFRIGDIDFEPFTVPHDAADNFGFVAKKDGLRMATLMDFGHITDLMCNRLEACDAVVIESNHSKEMLKACDVYSWDLKQRIMGDYGHLSNEDLSEWLAHDFDGAARFIVLAHLSQKANEPNLAKIMAETSLQMRPTGRATSAEVSLSRHTNPTPWITL